jgi:hypothetical protein
MNELGGGRVISFDHIAAFDSKVIPCDMKLVSEHIANGSLEVVVFCLSFLGKNWRATLQRQSDVCIYGFRC